MAYEHEMAASALAHHAKPKMAHKILKEFHAKELHDGTYHIQKHHGHDQYGVEVKPAEEGSATDLDGVHDHLEEHMGGPATDDEMAEPRSFAEGGTVQKTGMAMVHEGETVIPADKVSQALQSDKQDQKADTYYKALSQDKAGKPTTASEPQNAPKSPTSGYARTLRDRYNDYGR